MSLVVSSLSHVGRAYTDEHKLKVSRDWGKKMSAREIVVSKGYYKLNHVGTKTQDRITVIV